MRRFFFSEVESNSQVNLISSSAISKKRYSVRAKFEFGLMFTHFLCLKYHFIRIFSKPFVR